MEANANQPAPVDHEQVIDLALSAEHAVVWALDFDRDRLSWHDGLAELLHVPAERVEITLNTLIEPLKVAARTADVWQDLDLEQPFRTPHGHTRWIRFRARTT